MQEPIKRGGSDAGTDLRPAPTNRPPADRAAVRPAFPTGTAVTAGAGYRNQSTRFKSCSETNYPQPSRALHKNSGTASAKGSSTGWAKSRSGSRPSGSYPPHVVRVEGREEGEIVYRATLHLMRLDRRYDEQAKERQWAEMERDALAMLGRIGKLQGIFCTGNIALTPAEFSLTRQGELSMKAEFDARLYFPNEPDDKP